MEAGNMIEKDDLTNFLRKSLTYIREALPGSGSQG
ncbi:Protein of unknown function [Lactobacillus delbrueckii subsp. lactis]|nr:Putative uncharacterized protein [Lactobacillus delbrueckii subsp. lactis]CDR80465.1 Protein of unknown function [Lactobacillus delbrueckii subsp. lactis]CDR82123.1 Protein of unknown function [Lactobacillus delbrueckii subsp. lactis]CDR84816.1 Protein of unknown function [Lactobacillus delbrueckii subsp. lactis]